MKLTKMSNFKFLKDRFAFTLAEVLITLGIIGVVAALTLPTLIQKQTDRANVAKLQKVYSTLSQAYLFAKEEHGEIETWNIIDNNQNSTREIFSYFEPYLKILKKCDNKSGCWAQETKSLSGQTAQWSGSNKIGAHFYGFTLSDGTNISLDICGGNYAYFGLGEKIKPPFVFFWVDVNGNKKPNMLGRDIFGFAIDKKGLIPFGAGDNAASCSAQINNNTAGYGCAYKVITEKTINY